MNPDIKKVVKNGDLFIGKAFFFNSKIIIHLILVQECIEQIEKSIGSYVVF